MTRIVDLAYGEKEPAVAQLLEGIDGGARRGVTVGADVTVVHPTTWGRRRTAALIRSVGAADGVPRAVAIARSHADATVTRCAVVETTLLPDTGGHWSVHIVRRRAGEWTIETGLVDLPADVGQAWHDLIESADVVLIDGADETQVDAAFRRLPSPAGGTVRVDRDLVVQFGGVRRPARSTIDAALRPPPEPMPRRRRRLAVVAAAALVAMGSGWAATRGQPVRAQTVRVEQVGAATVDVPGDWRRTGLPDNRPVDGAGERAVFADPDDGRRIIVVVTALRAGSTRASVAVSMRNRLAQRGDDVIREFTADASFAGKQVIAYRETPASGPPIAWYIHVDRNTQVSIGCQSGTGDDPIDDPCADAVRSLL